MTVAKYLLTQIFWIVVISCPSSTLNNSWKDMRPIRPTASRVVRARAETHMVMMQAAAVWDRPNMVKKPATAPEKIWNGVPEATWPLEAAAQAMTRDTTPKTDSTHMEP